MYFFIELRKDKLKYIHSLCYQLQGFRFASRRNSRVLRKSFSPPTMNINFNSETATRSKITEVLKRWRWWRWQVSIVYHTLLVVENQQLLRFWSSSAWHTLKSWQFSLNSFLQNCNLEYFFFSVKVLNRVLKKSNIRININCSNIFSYIAILLHIEQFTISNKKSRTPVWCYFLFPGPIMKNVKTVYFGGSPQALEDNTEKTSR